jgi:hypothetical protein
VKIDYAKYLHAFEENSKGEKFIDFCITTIISRRATHAEMKNVPR